MEPQERIERVVRSLQRLGGPGVFAVRHDEAALNEATPESAAAGTLAEREATLREPWTGNEGVVASTWYHQAALVILPRDSELHQEVTGGAAAADELRVPRPIRRRAKP